MAVNAKTGRKAGAPLTDAEKDKLRELLRSGKTHRQIIDEMGIGNATLSRFKKAEGLTTPIVSPSQAAGAAAFQRNAAARRAARTQVLEDLFNSRAENLAKVQAGQAKYRTILKGAMGVEGEEELDFVPPADWRSEIQALANIGQAIDRADDRADDGGLARAQSMLAKVMEAVSGAQIEAPEGVITR